MKAHRLIFAVLPLVAALKAARVTADLTADSRHTQVMREDSPALPYSPHPVSAIESIDKRIPPACIPGESSCYYNQKEKTSWKIECNGNIRWAVTRYCGALGCCKMRLAGLSVVAYCTCPNSGDSSDQLVSNHKVESQSLASILSGSNHVVFEPQVKLDEQCTPGATGCVWAVGNQESHTMKCGKTGRWELKDNCGSLKGCKYSVLDKSAQCSDKPESKRVTPQVSPSLSLSDVKTVDGTSLDSKTCQPSEMVCAWDSKIRKASIWICNPSGQWVINNVCGDDSTCCKTDKRGVPSCDCRNKRAVVKAQSASPIHDEAAKAEAKCSFTCTSALASCKKKNACQMRQCREDICMNSRWECNSQACENSCALNTPPKEACGTELGCTPFEFRTRDDCLNYCGVRFPACWDYCTCKSPTRPEPGSSKTTLKTSTVLKTSTTLKHSGTPCHTGA